MLMSTFEVRCPLDGEWTLDESVSDEFNTETLDKSKWWDFTPLWRGRREYVNKATNVVQKNGVLELWTKYEPEKQDYEDSEQGMKPYTCAIVKSRAKVKYGYFEARIKGTPAEVRNAFWLYDPLSDDPNGAKYIEGSTCEEIDIVEYVGRFQNPSEHPYEVCSHVHRFATPYVEGLVNRHQTWMDPLTPMHDLGGLVQVDWCPSDDFHTYGLLWDEDKIVWYVDGVEYFRRRNDHYHTALHVMLDNELARWRGADPARLDNATLPAKCEVDWVRRWVRKDMNAAPKSYFHKDDVWVLKGDSITHNDNYRRVVLAALEHFHPDCGIRAMNTAVWGQLTSDAKGQGDDLKPDVVTIMLGMNDVIHHDYPADYDFTEKAQKYAETIREDVRTFQKIGAKVILMKPVLSDETEYSYFHVYHTRRGLELYGAALEKVAAEEGCDLIPVADDYELVKERAGICDAFSPDGVHPLGHAQYQIAKSLVERLGVALPLGGEGDARRIVNRGTLPTAKAILHRVGNLLPVGSAIPLSVESDVDGEATLVWSVGTERGEMKLHLAKGAKSEFSLELPQSAHPKWTGNWSRLFISLRMDGGILSSTVLDLAETRVYDLTSGKVGDTIPGVGSWEMRVDGHDLWIEGNEEIAAWPSRPADDIWMNSSNMNGLQTSFDFRPAERFAENRFDHDVSMIHFNVLNEPWSSMLFAWIGRGSQNALRANAEKTEKGFRWRMGFRGRWNDYTPFDISNRDYFGAQLIFQRWTGEKWTHHPIMGQYWDDKVRIDPSFFPNLMPVFDLKGDLPKPAALTVSVWTL